MTKTSSHQEVQDRTPGKGEILLLLDACSSNLASMRIAGYVAQASRARLKVLCVEDQRLLVAADLPFTREFRYRSTHTTKLNSRRLLRALEAFSDRARAQFEQLVMESSITGSFDTMRTGKHELLARWGSAADMLYLTGLGSRYSTEHKTRHTPGEAVYLFFDATPAAERALHIACDLCNRATASLNILCLTERAREKAESVLQSIKCTAQVFSPPGNTDKLDVVKSLSGRMKNILVVPDSLFKDQDRENLLEWLERSPCHALIVR